MVNVINQNILLNLIVLQQLFNYEFYKISIK